MTVDKLKTILYNTIILLYDNMDYKRLDSEDFINFVCNETGITKNDYKELMLNK